MGRVQSYLRRKKNKRAISAKKREKTKVGSKIIVESIIEEIVEKVFLVSNATMMFEEVSTSPGDFEVEKVTIYGALPETTKQQIDIDNKATTSGRESDDEYNFTWGSLEEYERISSEQLCVEKVPASEIISGRRIVDINYLLNQTVGLQAKHSKVCTSGMLELKSESRRGLFSTFKYKCTVCPEEFFVHSDRLKGSLVNKAAVWGTLATGSCYQHTLELFSTMEIPMMCKDTFYDIQRELGSAWGDCIHQEMEITAQEEHKIASAKGDVDENGIANIKVIVDGGWSKRSFGHSYNALSGVAVIIGKATGKLLFLGVKNKFCSICSRREVKNEASNNHICYKNWSGSASAMEAAIIVEGFNSSISDYKLKYIKFVGDGDSSVFSEIRKKVSYGCEVEKAECTNHCLKNYKKQLLKIKSNTKGVSLEARKLLTKEIIESLTKTAQNAVYGNAYGDVKQLKEDIRNSVDHVFGNHRKCPEYLCDKVGDTSNDKTNLLKSTGASHHIYAALYLLITKAHLLMDNETSNLAELYMSILTRFNMGKRLNLVQRNSYMIRNYLTGLRFNQGHHWHSKPWKTVFKRSPGKSLKKYMNSKEKERIEKRKWVEEHPNCKKKIARKLFVNKKIEAHYGPNISEVFLSEDKLHEEVKLLMQRLKVTEEEIKVISDRTKGQYSNKLYITEKKNRLTASNFGTVIKRRDTTSCDNLVKSILSDKHFFSPAVEYGKVNEQVAIEKFQSSTGKFVSQAGLYIHKDHGYLGASPDGVISDTEIVEVKCLYKVASSGKKLLEAVTNNDVGCLEIEGNSIQLKRNHSYYYQIQGQLSVCQKSVCYFIVYSGDQNDLHIENISRDDGFWEQTMFPKLQRFYQECLAPEIILGRRLQNLKCRDPPYIVESQNKKRKI